jgi:hypothetical protein
VVRNTLKRTAFGAALWLSLAMARAAEPIRHIGIYVQPYYEAAAKPGGHPRVAVGASVSNLLASARRDDILKVRDRVMADPGLVTPMTMMVLAIRLYDVGLRDDSVFWFYVAKDRYITFADVIDVRASGLGGVESAVASFASLAGPFINGYAFCDLARQQDLRRKALAWVERNPYEAMFMDRVVAKPGDRRENFARAIGSAKANAEKERAHFDDAKARDEFYAARKKNEMDVKFCWK